MNVQINYFDNPFSFFCVEEDESRGKKGNPSFSEDNFSSIKKISFQDVTHGQYLAVLIDNKWHRGIAWLENMFMIWLVDLGYYLRPNEKTIFVNLPPEYKKLPSKVFEASIHGVAPLQKELNDSFEFVNVKSISWNNGCTEKVKQLLQISSKCIFVPIAIMSTRINNVVLGDLYLVIPNKGVVNLIDELEDWPMFLETDREFYIQNLAKFYTTRRMHHACRTKPPFPNIPVVNPSLTLSAYRDIYKNVPSLKSQEENVDDSSSETSDGATLSSEESKSYESFKLSPQEIEKYSNEYIVISGIEYNVLNVLMNKARDLIICEKYKDRKSIGRANSKNSSQCY